MTSLFTRWKRGTPAWKRRLIGSICAALLIGWLGSSALVTWRLTRRDAPRCPEPLPLLTGLVVEDLQLTTEDGETIGAWLIRGEPSQPCAVVTHGRGGTRRHRLGEIEFLARQGCSVLATTHRALGDSTGEINDVGWSGRHDVVAAVSCAEREFPGQPIVIVGQSMGAAAAIFAANELGERVHGYFLEQPYRNLDSAVWHRLQAYLPTGFDALAYAGMRLWAPVLMPVDVDDVSPQRCARDIPETVPVTIICGSNDPHCPLEDVQQVFLQIKSHGELVVIKTDNHNPLHDSSTREYEAALKQFLEQINLRRMPVNQDAQ